jgi:hypothetical protein
MRGTEDFFELEQRTSLPPDSTIPAASWTALPLSVRVAHHLGDILSVADEVQGMLAEESAAPLRLIVESTVLKVFRDAAHALERLAC